MAIERRGVQGIRTMAALTDQRRTRSTAGALLELSALANEKLLLEREIARAARRGVEIERRLKEIGSKEGRLMKIVEDRGIGPAAGAPYPSRYTGPGAAAPGLPEAPHDSRLNIREFSY